MGANYSIQETSKKLCFSAPSLRSVVPDLERWACSTGLKGNALAVGISIASLGLASDLALEV